MEGGEVFGGLAEQAFTPSDVFDVFEGGVRQVPEGGELSNGEKLLFGVFEGTEGEGGGEGGFSEDGVGEGEGVALGVVERGERVSKVGEKVGGDGVVGTGGEEFDSSAMAGLAEFGFDEGFMGIGGVLAFFVSVASGGVKTFGFPRVAGGRGEDLDDGGLVGGEFTQEAEDGGERVGVAKVGVGLEGVERSVFEFELAGGDGEPAKIL